MAGSEYATVAQIESEFQDTSFTSSTQITDTEVTDWIQKYSGLVNQKLASKYTVPITDADALEVVNLIVRDFVKARIMRILNSDIDAGAGETERTQANACEKKATMLLKAIKDGSISLGGLVPKPTANPSSFNNDNDIDPIFERDTVQW